MEFLQNLLEDSQFPILTAFILGLMTSISPCPLATNISAIAFISKDISSKKRVFLNGLVYTLGRAIAYTTLGLVFYFGASEFKISSIFQGWGEKILGFPAYYYLVFFMLDFINIKFPGLGNLQENMEGTDRKKDIGAALLLGIVFALAFCPYSGVLYFGMLIPLTISSAKGLFLPIVFAIGTGLLVIVFAWLVAFAVGSVGNLYNKIKSFEKWFRRVAAVMFIAVGVYYIVELFFY